MTKGFGPWAVESALGAGLLDVGENYASELLEKAAAVSARPDGTGAPTWHFLGSIQRNKVPGLAGHVGLWQSVAREVEGARIAQFSPGAAVLVQVDDTGLPGRNGCPPTGVPALVADLRSLGLAVRGLMTVAAPGRAQANFEVVRRLADDLGLEERSMGMSEDLEAAVAAGSTMVRIGRALFGERTPRTSAGPA